MERSKENILKRYKSKDPYLFIQYASLDHQDGDDDLMKAGKEERCVTSGLTYELMSAKPDVRVLITAGTSMETALILIDKIKESIRKDRSWENVLQLEEDIVCDEEPFLNLQKEVGELLSFDGYTPENLKHALSTIKVIRNKNELDLKRMKTEQDMQRMHDELAMQWKKNGFDIPL